MAIDKYTKDFFKSVISELRTIVGRLDVLVGKADRPWHEDDHSPRIQSQPTEGNDATLRNIFTPSKVKPVPNTENNSHKGLHQTIKRWKPLIEIIGIGFAIFYAIVKYFQWSSLQTNFKVEQRAWAKIGISYPPLQNTSPWVMEGSISNFGKSPLIHVVVEEVVEIVPAQNGPSLNLWQTRSTSKQSPIFPGDTGQFSIKLFDQQTKAPRALTEKEASDLGNGTSYMAIFGVIQYADQFGDHWERFCRHYPKLGNADNCITWDEMGDGYFTPDLLK